MAIFHQAEYYYGKIYILGIMERFTDYILIKFFFGCITDISKRSDKNLLH